MKFNKAILDHLAKMICGDEPYTTFPYRPSSLLTSFFTDLYLGYRHDGSTRRYWVLTVLIELNDKKEISPDLPSPEMVKVIEHLLNYDHYRGQKSYLPWEKPVGPSDDKKYDMSIDSVNSMLEQYRLKVVKHTNGTVKVCSESENYVSTAVPIIKATKTITFTPSIFDIPDREPLNNIVSVMMPFAAEFDNVYKAIQDSCLQVELECYRADDIWQNSTFMQDIFDLIFCSMVVVVDFSGRNANVLYETGIAHTLGKIVIPITQSISDIPSDLQSHRALKYLPNREGLGSLTEGLTQRLSTIMQRVANG